PSPSAAATAAGPIRPGSARRAPRRSCAGRGRGATGPSSRSSRRRIARQRVVTAGADRLDPAALGAAHRGEGGGGGGQQRREGDRHGAAGGDGGDELRQFLALALVDPAEGSLHPPVATLPQLGPPEIVEAGHPSLAE